MKDIQITDAELEIMKILWSEPAGMTTGDIRSKLDKGWERTTVLTLLSRLAEKGAVAVEKENRSYRYASLLAKDEYSLGKTRGILDSLYNGSIKSMMAALCSSGSLTAEELRELQEILDKGER
jgi:BlaI family transcriptional regulator, penicillinase repressor